MSGKRVPSDALRLARRAWLAGRPVDMGALAEELGVGRATLYRWVGSKEKLLGEVVWSVAADTWEHALAASRGRGPDYVAEAIERYLRAAIDSPALRRFVEQ